MLPKNNFFLGAMTACLCIAGCVSRTNDDYAKYHSNLQNVPAMSPKNVPIVLLESNELDVRGDYDANDAAANSSIMYAGDAGAAGVLAQVFIHAAMVKNASNKKLSDAQTKANEVLAPLSVAISDFKPSELLENSQYSFSPDLLALNGLVLTSRPIFFLSQDTSVLTLKHVVEVRKIENGKILPHNKRDKSKPIYSNIVEVVSKPIDAKSAIEEYLSDGQYKFEQLAKSLYADSLRLVFQDLKGAYKDSKAKKKNYNISHGDYSRFERGSPLIEGCDRFLIRNLRGWLISFYNSTVQDDECSKESSSVNNVQNIDIKSS